MELIKIKVDECDRETFSRAFSFAIAYALQNKRESTSQEGNNYFLDWERKFHDLRQRIVLEELEDDSEGNI